MTNPTLHPLAADYLKRLRHAGANLPADRLNELYAEIEAHILEATDLDDDEVHIRNVLERLGDPADIIGAEAPPDRPLAAPGRGTREWMAIILLPIGGFFLGIGWVIGLIALWSSNRWSTRDKWIGTLLVPGGLLTPLLFLNVTAGSQTCTGTTTGNLLTNHTVTTEHCTGGTGTIAAVLLIALLIFLVLAPILSAGYLARRAR
jgi:hypothetical protein